jgi:very-short-patch-repair endonuclease
MTPSSPQPITGDAWEFARSQHDVIAHWQLRMLGYTHDAIRHRLRTGRLFVLWRGVYAVGRPTVTPHGRWKAATLACGPGSALDGESALALWDVRSSEGKEIEVAVPGDGGRRHAGISARRVQGLVEQVAEVDGIPVLSLPPLFVQLAGRVKPGALEAALNEADKKDLIHVEQLRREIEALRGRRGVAALRRVIDRATFRYTDSELERAMRPIYRAARLGEPETQVRVNGKLVDFYWPELNFVIETDGGRFHRTAFQQANDRRRDQAHTLANTAFLRFTHGQIRYERTYVKWAVTKKAGDLRASSGALSGSQPR